MTDTPSGSPADAPADAPSDSASGPAARKRGGGLSSMLLADLKSMAGGMGIRGAGSMKKAQLVDAIKAAQSGAAAPSRAAATEQPATPAQGDEEAQPRQRQRNRARDEERGQGQQEQGQQEQGQQEQGQQEQGQQDQGQRDQGGLDRPEQPREREVAPESDDSRDERTGQQEPRQRTRRERNQQNQQQNQNQNQQRGQQQKPQGKVQPDQPKDDQPRQERPDRQERQERQDRQDQGRPDQARQDQADLDDDGEGGSRRNRRRRGRERPVARTGGRNEPDTTILEDDVLVPAAGIIDVLDNYAFVRTSGYLPGPEDVYLSLSMVRRFGLRRGDAVVGQVRQPREGERREKFNPMVRIDSVNGADPESAKDRPEFTAATPVHPDQRLRLATDAGNVIGKVIDIAAPVGKGQRGLVLAPPRTGTTALLQAVATAVTTNNPECHVMVVLIDTRPEEVTDFQRAVKGEVIASTFDREPADHTVVAELAIERAKRLVELGHDVVVLLDSLTRLGRAYNLAAPANGRVLGGGVDATAVHPTKQFFGAARNIEDGGSLTILATVPVETGSAVDELFLEEVAGAANLELRLSSARAAKGIVPAVDLEASGTRHEELLLAPAEGAVVGDLRKKLAAASSQKDVVALVSGGR